MSKDPIREAEIKVWEKAAAFVDRRPCLGGPCRKWFRIPRHARRHNSHCPRFIAYVFRAVADGETTL